MFLFTVLTYLSEHTLYRCIYVSGGVTKEFHTKVMFLNTYQGMADDDDDDDET